MSIGSVIKKIAKAPGKVAGAVAQGVQAATAPPPVAPVDASIPEYSPPAYQPMTLPEIDPADPDREHKQAVHDWIRELEAAHAEHAGTQGKEYHDQYQKLADYAAKQPQERQFDPISAFMIGLGSPQGLEDVKAHNAAADKQSRDREDYLLGLKEQALKGNIQQMMDEGKFKQVLTQSAALEELHATQDRIKAAREQADALARIQETNKGKVNVANIRAAALIKNSADRIKAMQETYKLTAKEMESLNRQYGAAYNAYVNGHKDPLGQFDGDPDVLDKLWQEWHAATIQAAESRVPDQTTPKATTAGAGKPEDKVRIKRGGQTGTILRKDIKPTDEIIE